MASRLMRSIDRIGKLGLRIARERNDAMTAHDMLREDLAAIIRSVEPDWLTRGYGDADLRNKIREWADFMKWAGDDRAV